MARRLTAPPVPSWVGDLPVFERTLGNGMKALALPRPEALVVVSDLYYPAGSADEPPGRTGLAHFVEHMLFKGTATFPKGQIDRLAFEAAGQSNAETGEDCTHYWFAFPADRWELALAVEADRMRAALFDPIEVEAERHVIAEERAREMDSPLGRLDQTHLALTYLVHPYRNPILGWPEDLRRTTVEDLTQFYRAHYRPDGAVLVVVGAIDPDRALDAIEAQFGGLEPGWSPRPDAPRPEPPQNGRREFTLVESDSVARGLFGWHSVPRGHGDGPALDVLSDLLGCGRRSRLWDRLVERDRLATWVEVSQEPSHLAGQFLIQVEAAPGVSGTEVEDAIHAVLGRMAADGPTAEELSRSRNRLEAAWRWEQEDVFGLAAGLGNVAMWDHWQAWQAEHRAALAVTVEDVRRVASAHLVDAGLTVGWSVPKPPRSVIIEVPLPPPEPSRAAIPPGPDRPLAVAIPDSATPLVDYRPTRSTLDNGLRILAERRPGTGTVALDLFVDAGLLREAKPGLAHLVGRLREEGTLTRSAEAIAAAIEDVGGTLEVGSTGLSLRVRAEDLELAVELMADLTLRAAFPAEALSWMKRRIAAELRADRDDPSFRAETRFRSAIYGRHPYGRDPRGSAGSLAALALDDVTAHHERFFAPGNAFVVAVGDFDPRRLRSLLKTHLGGWPAREVTLPIPPLPSLGKKPRVRVHDAPGEQVHILIGHLGIARDDPDYDALTILDHILGSGPGFTDRLSRILRDELGLAYSVGGGIADSADVAPGALRVSVATSPGEADHAIAAATAQIEAMHRGEFTDEEVDRARRYLAGSWVFDYQTVGQRADRLLELERWGLPLDEPIHWPGRIAAVTAEQVRAAARKHIHPESLVRIEYGPTRGRVRDEVAGSREVPERDGTP